MKLFLFGCVLSFNIFFPSLVWAQDSKLETNQKSIVMGIIDRNTKSDFESKLLAFLHGEIQGCGQCQLKNYSAYDANGSFVKDASLTAQLQVAEKEVQILFINFNEKYSIADKALVESLKSIQASGKLIVFAAGQPVPGESSAPLSQTIATQVPNSFIIGELGEKDRLLGSSYFGPEMLTAIRPSKDLIGQGLAPSIFAARLLKNYTKRSDWVKFFAEKKLANRKIWLELGDCFR